MTTPVGFLDFFVLEASDYIEQLDGQLLKGGAGGPDADALQRAARALRGSATMAKLTVFAELAAGIERVSRALRERTLPWDPALGGALVAAVDDAKILLRSARSWSASDDARARARIDELARYAPARPATPSGTTATAAAGRDDYLTGEAANLGAGLELLATRPTDRDAAANVLRRVRALRGIAGVKDHPALSEVLQAAELAAHPLELGEPRLSDERIALLGAAANALRGAADAMRSGATLDASGADFVRFAAALDALEERETESESVVPIAKLFYDDGGATLVEAAPNPPTSPNERFRLEVVSQGEHLRRLADDARGAPDELARERVRRALRQALRGLREAAESFGESDVADFVASHNDAVVRLDAQALDSLDEVAALLAQPGAAPTSLAERLRVLEKARRGTVESDVTPAPVPAPAASPVPVTPPQAAEPVGAQPPVAAPAPDPSSILTPLGSFDAIAPPSDAPQERDRPAAAQLGAALKRTPPAGSRAMGDLLEAGIRSLGALERAPLSEPVAIPEQPPVPIEALLYRGRAAIERARELRDQVRSAGGAPDSGALDELFDLLDLALTD